MIDPTVSACYVGDCRKLLKRLPAESVQTCITSPPYWGLRDYEERGQIGLEDSPKAYVAALVAVFEGVRRVLRDDGTLWLNLGDSYGHGGNGARDPERWPKQSRNKGSDLPKHRKKQTGLKPKDLVGIPWMVAFALRDSGWYLRMDNIWAKPNPMPESVTDRTTRSHEYLFHFSKSADYYYDHLAIAEPATWERHDRNVVGPEESHVPGAPPHSGLRKQESDMRNKRSVWTVTPTPYSGAHFATYPPALIEPCVLACSRPGDLILDPFFGSGTTGEVAEKHERRWIGFDINPKYAELAKVRTAQRSLPLARSPK